MKSRLPENCSESASVSSLSHEGAAAELDQPVVLTPGMDAPAPAFAHDEPLPEHGGESNLGESSGTFGAAGGKWRLMVRRYRPQIINRC